MYEPCALIQDLLPLYRDGVCSDESRKAVEAHLKGCPACQAALAAMGAETPPPPPPGEADERQKAASFESVRRRFRLRTALAAGAAAATEQALRLDPGNERLRGNLRCYHRRYSR